MSALRFGACGKKGIMNLFVFWSIVAPVVLMIASFVGLLSPYNQRRGEAWILLGVSLLWLVLSGLVALTTKSL
jgi:hypothetical protein